MRPEDLMARCCANITSDIDCKGCQILFDKVHAAVRKQRPLNGASGQDAVYGSSGHDMEGST